MKHQLLFAVLLFCIISSAQTKLNFTYDNSGNQKTRIICINCQSGSGDEIKEEELNKQDAISYYPNPVKEELYIKWDVKDESYITSIQVHSFTGQLLKQYLLTNKTDNQNVPFHSYPSGIYAVWLKNNNGEEKTMKIIKQ